MQGAPGSLVGKPGRFFCVSRCPKVAARGHAGRAAVCRADTTPSEGESMIPHDRSTSLAHEPAASREKLPFMGRRKRFWLLIAFAFTVMADPISSVAYAIEAALRALQGNLGLLLPTMALVIVVIALVTVNYHQLVARFPEGGGAAAAAGAALGEAWAFLPIGALVVDFVLTIAISIAASASAIIAYFPTLAPFRLLLA